MDSSSTRSIDQLEEASLPLEKFDFNSLPYDNIVDILKKLDFKSSTKLMKSSKRVNQMMQKIQRFDSKKESMDRFKTKIANSISNEINHINQNFLPLLNLTDPQQARTYNSMVVQLKEILKSVDDTVSSRRVKITDSSWILPF